MIKKYRFEKKANKIINVTNQTFYVYEDFTGKIRMINPSNEEEAAVEKDERDDPKTYYAVTEETARAIRMTGGELDRIAIVSKKKDTGRHGVKITRLVWAKNPEIKVCLCG